MKTYSNDWTGCDGACEGYQGADTHAQAHAAAALCDALLELMGDHGAEQIVELLASSFKGARKPLPCSLVSEMAKQAEFERDQKLQREAEALLAAAPTQTNAMCLAGFLALVGLVPRDCGVCPGCQGACEDGCFAPAPCRWCGAEDCQRHCPDCGATDPSAPRFAGCESCAHCERARWEAADAAMGDPNP